MAPIQCVTNCLSCFFSENWTKRLRRCREQEEADEANIAEIENLKNQTKAAAEDEELNNIVLVTLCSDGRPIMNYLSDQKLSQPHQLYQSAL